MKKIKILIVFVILIIIILGVYFVLIKNGKEEYSLIKVSRGNVVEEVSETGAVKKGEEINLGLKSAGRI